MGSGSFQSQTFAAGRAAPVDLAERELALNPEISVLVQAPAGSGKTTLLAERFLRLLATVEEPGQIVAITFTNAAAAEMRHRILERLSEPEPSAAARAALERSQSLGWNLLEVPGQMRILTIDAFCRELALQQPLLSGLGGGLEIAAQPAELYRRAAASTLRKIDRGGPLGAAIEALLLWRDNHWQELEDQLVTMLGERDRWMQGFVLNRSAAGDEDEMAALRERLERPFANAVRAAVEEMDRLLDQVPRARQEALALARFGCAQSGGRLYAELAEMVEFPRGQADIGISFPPIPAKNAGMGGAPADDLPSESAHGGSIGVVSIEQARSAFLALAKLLLTDSDSFRKQVNVTQGFPADRKPEKARLLELIAALRGVEGLEAALAGCRALPPTRYEEEDWQIVRACFTLLRHAAGELQVVFAEAGAVDFIEVSQIAERVLRGPDGLPTDAAMAVADKIRHLLVDEFQDTSRRQHQLLASLVAAWPEREGRSCFAVGDPMQSIYFFRDADAELFSRVKAAGFEVLTDEPLRFEFAPLQANFRSAPGLVERLNDVFAKVFAREDGSGVRFSKAAPARGGVAGGRLQLHLEFVTAMEDAEAARARQASEMVGLIRDHLARMEEARRVGGKYRIAVLGRTRSALTPIATALREAGIPFRALDLEKLGDRPEVRDAVGLGRALLNAQDRVAWLGVLRAPWCGLSLAGLHKLVSDEDADLLARAVPELLAERLELLEGADRWAAARVLEVLQGVPQLRAARPDAALGTLLQQVWQRLGGAACVDAAARANLELLWSCLDQLPHGEQDLLGPAWEAALEKLTALPDPAAESDFGVQLMTIHKSKGLEFEVVLVPELQAPEGRGGVKMLSWLERGVARREESEEITEFLIAPLQTKGADKGSAKAWVDGVYRERERQEMRRILYVAATRAREELHLFARPACRADELGGMSLVEPMNSLLATAWPALEDEAHERFEEWKASVEEGFVEALAAGAAGMGRVSRSDLRRLPVGFQER